MADILDEAQKKINDAATPAGDASSPPATQSNTGTSGLQSAPTDDDAAAKLVDTLIKQADAPTPPATPSPAPNAANLPSTINDLPSSVPPPEPPQVDMKSAGGPAPKKKRNIGVLIASFFFLLLTVPLVAYYVSLQGQIADTRDRAAEGGQCDVGGPAHEYNECCGAGKSRHVVRTCVGNGVFRWDTGDCNQDDAQCGNKEEGSKNCPAGQVWQDGACHEIGSCEPSCKGKSCGENDGCSGVCTEKCDTKDDANNASNQGPKEDPNGGIVNKGNKKNDECDNSGNCSAKDGQTIEVCNCDSLESGATCKQNCTQVSGSQSCQQLANDQCKVIQIDVRNDKGKIIDTAVCTPNKNSPACGGTGGGTGGTDETTGGGGGGKNKKFSCDKLRVYKDGKVVKGNDLKKLKAGDAIVFAVAGTKDKKARVRVNGGAWTETTEKNDKKEFIVNFTLPSGTTKFTIEAEVQNAKGTWK